MNVEAGISLRALLPAEAPVWLRMAVPVVDRMLGIHMLARIYHERGLEGLPPFEFASRSLDVLGLRVQRNPGFAAERIPGEGAVIMVCNHPFGAIEALVVMHLLRGVRQDIKFLANGGLQVFRELRSHFISANPLKTSVENLSSIRQCEKHLASGGLLVIFPAGRVSFRPRGERRIRDASWHRIVGYLARRSEAQLLPVFFHGSNSALFQFLGNVWDRLKLLLLPREFLRMRGSVIRLVAGRPVPPAVWRHLSAAQITLYARFLTYSLESAHWSSERGGRGEQPAPLAPLGDRAAIVQELETIPRAQRVLDYKQYSVYYAVAGQIPVLLRDIARERERVFRQHDEGSGTPRDGDGFDQTYVHLFVWDHQARSLVGAYRMGQSDRLRCPGAGGLYLARMFEFDDAFYVGMPPALELGRSFVVPEHQKSFHALYLLWRGIGEFLLRHPRYRRLYGTVSLSRQYSPSSVAVMCASLIEPSPHVRPRIGLEAELHPEWHGLRTALGGRLDLPTLSACVQGLDSEGKDIPVLLRHYHRLGARFLGVGIDPHFNATPGLLLCVDMERVPVKVLATYLGARTTDYLSFQGA